jgi:enhancing lycopene biosynthesis protein 2
MGLSKSLSMAKKIAVVLAGCGNKDGSEITEAVSLIIALSASGAQMTFFAPNIDFTARNFLTNSNHPEKRNLMLESARITRSQIQDLKNLNSAEFDGLAFPGGMGAALHLSNWSEAGAKCRLLPDVEKSIQNFHQSSKPIAAICIAPTLIAKVLGPLGVELTLGNDPQVIQEIQKTGAHHIECPVSDFITDRAHKVVTTPAYMHNAKPHEVFEGISGLVREFMEMA